MNPEGKISEWQEAHPFFIKEVIVKGFLGSKNIKLTPENMSVVIGPNGSGKTTLLNILSVLLLDETPNPNLLSRFDSVEIIFNNGESFKCLNGPVIPDSLKDSFKSFFKEKLFKEVRNKFSDLELESDDDYHKVLELIQKMSNGHIGALRFNRDFIKENTENNLVNVRRISTFDMIMLDREKLDKYPKPHALSQLDVILNDEISELTKHLLEVSLDSHNSQSVKESFEHNTSEIQTFKEVLNELLSVTDKTFTIEKNGDFSIQQYGKRLKLTELSSGEKQLLYIMTVVVNTKKRDTIILMDEPEVSLSLKWQKELINSMYRINPNLQILLVSHSPAVVTNGWLSSLIEIENMES